MQLGDGAHVGGRMQNGVQARRKQVPYTISWTASIYELRLIEQFPSTVSTNRRSSTDLLSLDRSTATSMLLLRVVHAF
jgi:hypothetical protein